MSSDDYCGGRQGVQVGPFMTGFAQILPTIAALVQPKSILLETLYLDELCKNHMTIADLVDWLLGGHIHFILAHVHQGLEFFLIWNK